MSEGSRTGGAVPALPPEVRTKLYELGTLAGVHLDRRTSDIICEMLHENVTPTGIIKMLESLQAASESSATA
jgi:hypothetical protein